MRAKLPRPMYQNIDGIHVWAADGQADEKAVAQMRTCSYVGNVAATALMADHHLGYAQPIGGVVAYRDAVSLSGVGYDIACGVKAVRTNLTMGDIYKDHAHIADEIARQVRFGVGSQADRSVDHAVFDDPAWDDVKWLTPLKPLARRQLGSCGSGNHYVDVLMEDGWQLRADFFLAPVWIAAHFGSRGFGHQTATGFLHLAANRGWSRAPVNDDMMANPTVIEHGSKPYLFDSYIEAMTLAGRYAYAGRDLVVDQVLGILGAKATDTIHNHHNFAWSEWHGGENLWVVRKGATPAAPGQKGFVGGSMGDIAAVVEGTDTDENRMGLYSTVHGAGRIMSRSAAAGNRRGTKPGAISREMMTEATEGVEVRGGGLDESPQVYRKLASVLDAHSGTTKVLTAMKPIVVVMAGADGVRELPSD